ncbi:hypothetical protein [Streptomyces sp. NPDC016845]|uniref:hypothetical protein n=1 Tax=Streptomyces sp. NPDC016845 TaxID=3364972 RepID=UPI00379FFB33
MKRLAGLAALLTAAGGALLLGCSSNECSGGSVCGAGNAVERSARSEPKPTPSASRAAEGPLLVTYKWPTAKVCDGATSVAMARGGPSLARFDATEQDFRSKVATRGGAGGTWGGGHLYLDLSAKGSASYTVDELHLTTRVPKRIDPPSWVALTQGGCGELKDRVFALDLDTPELVDHGVSEGEPDPSEPPVRTDALGSGFTVSAKDPAIVRVDASACRGDYEWSLRIDYSYDGRPLHKNIGPFRSYSTLSADTAMYVPDPVTGEPGEPITAETRPVGCPAGGTR